MVGRTRLQKIAYLLVECGFEDSIPFSYRHYGPYSEDLAEAARNAGLLGIINEEERMASWGGVYSIFSTEITGIEDITRSNFARTAAEADAVELELAATALFLSREGHSDPWGETARRKPEKAALGRLDRAMTLYRRLAGLETPVQLPPIA